jgi:chemotaxis protein MotB
MLQEQVVKREKRIQEQQNTIAELDSAKQGLENRLNELLAQVQDRERIIADQQQKIQEMAQTRRQIETTLKKQIKDQQIKLEEMEGRLKVTFVDKILFESGSVDVRPEGKELLLKLAEDLKTNKDQSIEVEGHTDNVLIGPELRGKYPTNWELSAARATAVVRFLEEKGGISPQRFTACGFSYYRPVASNNTEEGRRQNRRIEIVLVPKR